MRILIVDDDELSRRALARSLGRRFEVTCSPSAEHALALLAEGRTFDVILCDQQMSGMSGAEFFEQIRAHDEQLAERVLFLSGAGAEPEHAARHVCKTTSFPDLLARIDATARLVDRA